MYASISCGVDIYIKAPAGIPATDFSSLFFRGAFEQFNFSVQDCMATPPILKLLIGFLAVLNTYGQTIQDQRKARQTSDLQVMLCKAHTLQ